MAQRMALPLIIIWCFSTCGPSAKYYGMKYDLNIIKKFPGDKKSTPDRSVARILRTGTTVAFNPPDRCLDMKATPSGTKSGIDIMSLQCGVLLAELEQKATEKGYNVVSWQALRGKDRPIAYARAQHVDILFEVNELSLPNAPIDVFRCAGGTYHEIITKKDRPRIQVDNADVVDARCMAAIDSVLKQSRTTLAATLDLKMVDVNTGRVLWYYRKTTGYIPALEKTNWLNYKADRETRAGWVGMLVPSILMTIIGGVVLGEVDSSKKYIGVPLVLLGPAGIATSIYKLVSRNPYYKTADEVLCRGRPINLSYGKSKKEAVRRVRDNRTSAGFNYTRETPANTNELENARRRLVRQSVAIFMEALDKLSRR